ncbi:MAG: hypothetical protein LAO56_23755 [Acidobacteriia bacterium]|nr:hypothetical protein [Terriglobia bacterium]
MLRLFREITERIAKEQDRDKLRQLVLGINRLSDAVKAQLARIEGAQLGTGIVSCKRCTSENQSGFSSEIAIHLRGLNTPHVFVFPMAVVCLDCGFTEFSIPETELRRLAESDSTAA